MHISKSRSCKNSTFMYNPIWKITFSFLSRFEFKMDKIKLIPLWLLFINIGFEVKFVFKCSNGNGIFWSRELCEWSDIGGRSLNQSGHRHVSVSHKRESNRPDFVAKSLGLPGLPDSNFFRCFSTSMHKASCKPLTFRLIWFLIAINSRLIQKRKFKKNLTKI